MFLLSSLVAFLPILAQLHDPMSWSFGNIAIGLVITVVIIGVIVIVLRVAQITIPPWLLQIIGLVALGVVAILAIKFLISMW